MEFGATSRPPKQAVILIRRDSIRRDTGMKKQLLLAGALLATLMTLACGSKRAVEIVTVRHYPLDDLNGVLTTSGASFDSTVSSDGAGSLKIVAEQPAVVRLFETGDIDIEDARLLYKARLKTEQVRGMVYLEMWCHFPGMGESFSRGLQSPLSGTTGWVTEEISFFLKKGENPDNVKLNLVIDGTGTVWIDAIEITRAPLNL